MKLKKLLIKRSSTQELIKANFVPLHYYPYLIDLNFIYSQFDSSVILGRDKEIDRVFNCLLRDKKRNAILVGEHGVGKTAILQKLVYRVLKGNCPAELKNYHFVLLDVQNMIANIDEISTKKKLKKIMEFVTSYNNLVLVIDQVHLVQVNYLLSYYFSYSIKSSNLGVIGITTADELYDFFELDTKTLSRLEIIDIKEPKAKNIYPMIKKVIERLSQRHGVTISRELVEYIISLSGAFSIDISNPELTLDIVEKSMIFAKKRKQKVVTKQDINKNLNFDYELYNSMTLNDKKATAYHEAGHFIVNKLSDNIKNLKTTAITIVPAENFLGVTTFEFEPEKQLSCDFDYYIDNIAVDLAGRVAETIFYGGVSSKKRYTSGANADLISATNTARAIITEFGMVEGIGENMSLLGNYNFSDFSLLSDNNKNQINNETSKLVKIALERAEKILYSNIKLLEKLVEELLNNDVLDEKDLDKICREVEAK